MSTERKSSIALMNIHRDCDAVIVNFSFFFFLLANLWLTVWEMMENPTKNVTKIVLLQVTYAIHLGGCLHDTGATFVPERVHSGSLSWVYICLHDSNTKFYAGASHPGVSSPQFSYRGREFHSGTKSRNGIMKTRNDHPFRCEIGLPVDWTG